MQTQFSLAHSIFPLMRLPRLAMILGVAGSLGTSVQAAPADATPDTVTGKLSSVVADDFAGRRAELLYFIEDARTSRKLQLQFSGKAPARVANGRVVTLAGQLDGDRLVVDDSQAAYLAAGSVSSGAEMLAETTAAVAGDQRTLVLLADFQDVRLDCTATAVRDTMFTSATNQSVDDLFRESSRGAVGFSGQVAGPYPIAFSSGGACDINGWANALEAQAAASGVDVTQYPRKVIVLPRQNTCNASGYGSLGGAETRAWIMRCELPGLYAHELGHNLGMNHATTPTSDYGDGSDPMGMEVLGLRQHNAPHLEQMGWLAGDRFRTVTASGSYDVSPTELGLADAVAPQALVVAKADTGDSYYVSYRVPMGFDVSLSRGLLERLHIHRYARNGGRTTYVTGLLVGEAFSDSTNSISITHVSRASNYATVDVKLGATTGNCTRSAPAVSFSPAVQSALAGETVGYTVTVRNNDSGSCPGAVFALAASVPAGWSSTVSPASLAIAPGASSAATLQVTSSSTAAAATYSVAASVADSTVPGHAVSASGTYSVTAACVRRAPVLSLSPGTQSGAPGQLLRYVAALSNQDDSTCGASSFSLQGIVPNGWSSALSRSSLTLTPGTSAQFTVDVASASTATTGSYAVAASVADGAGRTASASGVYGIAGALQDLQPPSVPTGLAASPNTKQLRVNLTWTASTDNAGVTGYRVWRDGRLLGETAGTWYLDGAVALGATYSYYVTARDAAGNESAASASVTTTLVRSAGGTPKKNR